MDVKGPCRQLVVSTYVLSRPSIHHIPTWTLWVLESPVKGLAGQLGSCSKGMRGLCRNIGCGVQEPRHLLF